MIRNFWPQKYHFETLRVCGAKSTKTAETPPIMQNGPTKSGRLRLERKLSLKCQKVMATETSKRNPNSASKNRKSRNEIIRSTLGIYLKQRNYMVNNNWAKKNIRSVWLPKWSDLNKCALDLAHHTHAHIPLAVCLCVCHICEFVFTKFVVFCN